jgi:hypothetical protein
LLRRQFGAGSVFQIAGAGAGADADADACLIVACRKRLGARDCVAGMGVSVASGFEQIPEGAAAVVVVFGFVAPLEDEFDGLCGLIGF